MLIPILLILIWLLYYLATRNFDYWKNLNIKGPKPVPVFGNFKDVVMQKTTYGEVFKKIYQDYPSEKVVGVYRMTSPCLLIRDPEIIKNIFIKDFDNFISRGVILSDKDVGATLFHSDPATYRDIKGIYTPMFTTGKLKAMIPTIVDCADRFIKYLEKKVESNPEEIKAHITLKRYTISVIAATSFTLNIAPDDEIHTRLTEIDKDFFELNILNEIDMMFPWVLRTFKQSVFPANVRDFFKELTVKILNERKWKATNENDFMDNLLQLRNKDVGFEVTDDILAAQTMQLFGAGYETSASTLGNMCHFIAIHKDVKDKLIKEVETKLEAYNNKVTYELLNDLVYMENVLAETLRMYPVLDPLQRMPENDYYIPEIDFTLKKNRIVLVSVAGLNFDKKYYPEPHKFKPERFDDPKLKEMMQTVYLPFGTGPRYCIGIRHGKMQIKILLIKLLMKFDITTTSNTDVPLQFKPYTFLRAPLNGLPLKFVPRFKKCDWYL